NGKRERKTASRRGHRLCFQETKETGRAMARRIEAGLVEDPVTEDGMKMGDAIAPTTITASFPSASLAIASATISPIPTCAAIAGAPEDYEKKEDQITSPKVTNEKKESVPEKKAFARSTIQE
ncbi:hypothetical protein BGX33_004831, partial [Mortierella sp. NVP41]